MNTFLTIFMMSPAPVQGAAEGAAKPGSLFGGSSVTIIMMVLIFAVMWLLMIRPQQKQQKELAKFRNSLEKGAKVVTAGGIHGTVKEVNANTVTLQVDKDVTIEVDKTMIMRAPGA
jgi:preprotein translocase subunit YajC